MLALPASRFFHGRLSPLTTAPERPRSGGRFSAHCQGVIRSCTIGSVHKLEMIGAMPSPIARYRWLSATWALRPRIAPHTTVCAMHAPAASASRMIRSFGLALIAALVCSSSVIPLVAAAPAPAEQAQVHAAYPCNTGTTSGMTFTYDDVHRWNDPIIAISNLTGVPANVIKGIMWVESRGMLNARSPLTSSGYYFGLMQIGATSAVPEYMKSVSWMCNNPYNQILAGATELVNKSAAIGSSDWTKVAGAYFGYGTDVTGTTTNTYMQMFTTHATAMIGTSPGATDWTPPAPPTPTPISWLTYPPGATLTVDTARLNLRATPGTSGTIIRVLTRGQTAVVLDGPQKIGSMYWYRIQLPDGTIGWIAGNYTTAPPSTPTTTATPSVTPTPSDTPTPSVTPTIGSTTPTSTPSPTQTPTLTPTSNAGALYRTTARLNLRATPSTSGTILATLASGTIVTLLGESQEASGYIWQRVRAGSRTGWVAMTYLRPSISPTPLPTRTPSRPRPRSRWISAPLSRSVIPSGQHRYVNYEPLRNQRGHLWHPRVGYPRRGAGRPGDQWWPDLVSVAHRRQTGRLGCGALSAAGNAAPTPTAPPTETAPPLPTIMTASMIRPASLRRDIPGRRIAHVRTANGNTSGGTAGRTVAHLDPARNDLDGVEDMLDTCLQPRISVPIATEMGSTMPATRSRPGGGLESLE